MGCSGSAEASSSAVPSQRIDFHQKYFLGLKLGRGSFGQVRICTKVSVEEAQEQEERAVKILNLFKQKEGETVAMLKKAAYTEVRVWKSVGRHPNCMRLHDAFFNQEFCYMVMEKCASSLYQVLNTIPEYNERSLGKFFAQMLAAIEHCHSVEIMHRDVKPDNFLVGGSDGLTIKLGDFGLSTAIPPQGKLTGLYGTAPYMCPEMLISRSYDAKADVWSLGVIAYALLFGLFPYMPRKRSCSAMKLAIIECAEPPSFEPVEKGNRQRSANAVALVQKLLQREPTQRPSAQEALALPWMTAVKKDKLPWIVNHMPDDLPSLRPMLVSAKKVGAFEDRDTTKQCGFDKLLSDLQMQAHGEPLPIAPPANMKTSLPQPKVKQEKQEVGTPHPSRDSENSDNSTSATSSSMGKASSITSNASAAYAAQFGSSF